jgi:hypothetical protein
MYVLQTLPQMANRGMFSPEQRIHTDAQLSRELLETSALQFVRDEYFALFERDLIESRQEFIREYLAHIAVLGAPSRGGKPFV